MRKPFASMNYSERIAHGIEHFEKHGLDRAAAILRPEIKCEECGSSTQHLTATGYLCRPCYLGAE